MFFFNYQIERIVEGGETAIFKQYFFTWKEPESSYSSPFGRVYAPGSIIEWSVNYIHYKFLLKTIARLAQSVEHETLNLRVVGSSPTLGEIIFST
jgi:hypothetical protein